MPWAIQPVFSHLLHGRFLHIIAAPDPISIVKHTRFIKTHMSMPREAALHTGYRVNLILMPPRRPILPSTSSILREMKGVERCNSFVICGCQKFRCFVHTSFELGWDYSITPDVRSSCVGLLAWVNVQQGCRVAGLDNFAGKDGIGETRVAAVSLNMLGNTGCVEKDGIATRAVERLRDTMHLS